MAGVNRVALRRLLLVLLVAVFYGVLWAHPQWMARLGSAHSGIWFLDTHAVLASSDADALGLDPYAPNPLDFHRQPHVYSGWWLHLHRIGLTRDDYLWIGCALGFTFLALAAAQLKVRSLGEVLWSAAFLAAPPVLLGFNRGNADLLIFLILALTVPCLLARSAAVRWLAVVALLIGTALKFYPIVGVVVLLVPNRPRREILLQIGAFLVASAASLLQDATMLRGYAADPLILPPWGFHVFGAGLLSQILHVANLPVLLVAIAVGTLAAAIFWRRMPAWPADAVPVSESLPFVLGATLITGCYFATVNYGYRLVFGIWMAPVLWQAWTDERWPRAFRIVGRTAGGLLIAELWLDALLRLPLTSEAALRGDTRDWALRMVAGEQVLAAALALALIGLLAPWVRDQVSRGFALGRSSPPDGAGAPLP